MTLVDLVRSFFQTKPSRISTDISLRTAKMWLFTVLSATAMLLIGANSINTSLIFSSAKDLPMLDFNSIAEFKSFVETSVLKSEEVKSSDSYLKDRAAILDLHRIITDREVCSPFEVDELIEYHKKYFLHDRFFRPKNQRIKHFFTKYAIQVAYTCKKNLLRNLEIARQELKDLSKVFDEARDKVFNEEPIIKSNIKLIEEQPDNPVSSNVKPQDELQITLGEYREALTQLKRPEDILTFEKDDCQNNRNRYIKISNDKLQIFFKPALMCHQLHRFYSDSLLSIAKLANHGYVALEDELDKTLLSSPALNDWIVAAQVCDPMVHMHATENNEEWTTVDTCAPEVSAIEPMIYDDNILEFELDLLGDMMLRSEATRAHAQKLMKSALKKIARANLMKQLKSRRNGKSIFSKSLAMFASQYVDSSMATESSIDSRSISKFSLQLTSNVSSFIDFEKSGLVEPQLSDKESYELLMKVIDSDKQSRSSNNLEETKDTDSAVSFFDPMSTLVSTFTVLLIMLSFEWLFFVVMILAGRICQHLHFDFGDLLTFPPKFTSWADADFARFNDMVEKMDEDDFFDYDELTQDEQAQRDLLRKVFGKPPPMLYKD